MNSLVEPILRQLSRLIIPILLLHHCMADYKGERFPDDVVLPTHAALLWQKEASDTPSKSELLMSSYSTLCALLPGQILCMYTLILLLRDMLGKTS